MLTTYIMKDSVKEWMHMLNVRYNNEQPKYVYRGMYDSGSNWMKTF